MIAMLYASMIIRGARTYASVPETMKPQVKKILEEEGAGHLITE